MYETNTSFEKQLRSTIFSRNQIYDYMERLVEDPRESIQLYVSSTKDVNFSTPTKRSTTRQKTSTKR
jgi:hypothetical protein